MATAPALRTLLDQLRAAGVRFLALNLAELDFLGAAGVHALIRADRQFRSATGWVVLTHPTDRTRRVLQITGLDNDLTLHPYQSWHAPTSAPTPHGSPVQLGRSPMVAPQAPGEQR
ncbi:STAS domain-containing protein [Pseudonocardia sp. KRD-291]|nr:STAS domain-containing protein [Pseudonocardia sp. KRD291]